MIEVKL